MYRVKSASPDNAASLIAVWRKTWPTTYASTLGEHAVKAMLDDLDRNGVATLLPEVGAQALCLLNRDKVVGTAIHSFGRPVVYLWGMYVVPQHQRLGAGTALFRCVQAAAGEKSIEVRVVQSSRQASRFYRKLGFTAVREEVTEIMPNVEAVCVTMRHGA